MCMCVCWISEFINIFQLLFTGPIWNLCNFVQHVLPCVNELNEVQDSLRKINESQELCTILNHTFISSNFFSFRKKTFLYLWIQNPIHWSEFVYAMDMVNVIYHEILWHERLCSIHRSNFNCKSWLKTF